jgi:sugar phosphate isomerase/epimerase
MKMTNVLSRRNFLSRMGAAGAALAFSRAVRAAEDKPYGGFKMGLQSYSLRAFPFEKAIGMIKELGLHYVEAFPGQLPTGLTQEQREKTLALLKENDVRLIAWGVQGFGNNAERNRATFEFAKAMGIETISADPTPDSFDNLDKLVEEFGINIAIHPHGPGSRWAKVEQIQNAIKDHHKRIGICIDTGHLVRAGEDIVQAVNVFKERVYGVHLKDTNEQKHDVIVGTGKLDMPGFFKALKSVKFNGIVALEYELDASNPMPGIKQSLEYLRRTLS